MQGLIVLAAIVWVLLRAYNKSGGKKKSAQASRSRRMRDMSTLSQEFGSTAQKPRDAHTVSQARPARPKDEPCRECETEFGYRPAAPKRAEEPRPAMETAAPVDVPCDACETNFGYRPVVKPSSAPPEEDAPAPAPGLHLAFDENAVVQGFIYSEILGNRPRARRNTWNPYAR